MSKKRKIINIILIFCMIVCAFFWLNEVYAEEYNEVNFAVVNTEEDYEVYLLLPEKYIKYINEQKNLNFKINDIAKNTKAVPRYINYFDANEARKELYEENGIKYLQVKLKNVAHNFIFYIAPGYTDMDMKIRYTSNTRDIIIHLDNFTYNQDGICKVTYDYKTNDFRTADEVKAGVSRYVVILVILLIVMCIVNMTDDKGKAKAKRKNN